MNDTFRSWEQATGQGAPYDARSIANLILDRVEEHGKSLTQLQLYKIVYFAHGSYLARKGKPLIDQAFEAWNYGPVVRVLRDCFKDFGKNPINGRAEKFDLLTGEIVSPNPVEDLDDRSFITEIVDFYHLFDGWTLSDLTHEEGSPWDKVWNSPIPVGNLGLRIDNREICSYFVHIDQGRKIH